MKNNTRSLYYSRTETEQSIVIVWKPFSTYSTFILLVVALVGTLCSMTVISLFVFLLLAVNAVVYSVDCKKPRNEINKASLNSSVQVSGNKFSLSSPLTVTIAKKGHSIEESKESCDSQKQGGIVRRVIFGFLTVVFLLLGFFLFSAMSLGIRQNAHTGSLIILLVLALIFFLLAFLCFKAFKK